MLDDEEEVCTQSGCTRSTERLSGSEESRTKKGAERGNLCPKRFTRKRITGMAEKGDQNKMGM